MGLYNFFKPKWQHSDPKIRLKAVQAFGDADRQTLLQLVTSDPNQGVRQAALAKIDDWRQIAPLVTPDLDPEKAGAINHRMESLQRAEVSAAVALEAKLAALAVITSDQVLADIALSESGADIRLAAIARIGDQAVLADLITKNCGKDPALLAIDKIDDEALLRMAAKNASNRVARAKAQRKFEEIEAIRNRPDQETARRQELAAMLERVAILADAVDAEAALSEYRQLERRWRELAGDDSRKGEFERHGALIRSRHQQQAAAAEAARAHDAARREVLHRLQAIVAEIEAMTITAIGDEELRLQALQQEWDQAASRLLPPPSELLVASFAEMKGLFAKSRTRLAQEKTEEVELLQLLNTVATLIEQMELEQALVKLGEAQRAFDGWRPGLVSRQQAADRLRTLREQQQTGVARRDEMQRLRLETNWQQRQGLLAEAKALMANDDVKGVAQRFADIRTQWQQPMDLPAGVADLELEFTAVGSAIDERLQVAEKEESWRRWQNKNVKAQLIEQSAALDGETDLHRVFKRIKELQEEWRRVGPAPAKDEPALWRRFQETTDRNFARCRTFFQELDAEAERNLKEKIVLRDQAVACQDSSDWQKTAELIKDLQAQWKAVGRGPQDQEQEVFAAFRAACDHFFERRKSHRAALEQERLVNLERKTALCQDAEALADQPSAENTAKFQDLQAQWKTVGPVPRDQEETVWQRFRAACDQHYDWLDSLRPQNLIQKQALCAEAEALAATIAPDTNFVQLVKKAVALQRKWKEIGPVPKDAQEAIWQSFKGSCDACFAAKARHEEAVDLQRPHCQAEKEALLAQVRGLIASPTITKDTVREIIAAQESWQGIGLAVKESEEQLQRDFKVACDSFFKERREAFQAIDQLHRENLKKKEALCLRLELLAGMTPQPTAHSQGKQGGMTLAEQLKVAFETNFVLAADDTKNRKQRAKDELEAVNREWRQIGPVPREHEHSIRKRYNEALALAAKMLPGKGE